MKKALGITDLLAAKFEEYPFEGHWQDAFGRPEKNFKMLIYGPEKNGKTNLSLSFCKYLTTWGKVYYNSHEEGKSKTLQEAVRRNNLETVAGKIMFLHKEPFDMIGERLQQKGAPRFLVIDSIDYMKMTEEQYKTLCDMFPRKTIIMLSWEDTKHRPLLASAKKIAKRVDILAYVKNGTVYPTSRFGGNKPYTFWEKAPIMAGTQLTLLNHV